MLSPPSSTFDVSTGEGMMTICLDHGNWNNLEVYRDNAITPPMCPGKYILLAEFQSQTKKFLQLFCYNHLVTILH